MRPVWRNRQKSLVCSEKWSVYDHAARVTRKKVARQSAGLLSPFQNRRQFYGKVQDRNFLRPIPLSPPQCLFQPQINMFPPPLPFLRKFLLGKSFSSNKATEMWKLVIWPHWNVIHGWAKKKIRILADKDKKGTVSLRDAVIYVLAEFVR